MNKDEFFNALIMMVEQYLTVEIDGESVLDHAFMTAGEYTLDVLEERGIVKPWHKNPNYYVFSTNGDQQVSESKG
ncbi:MAG: hypothetical protein RLZZ490_1472 [Cyanobacteriota bacterium]|jgi:hypothetical protein